MNDKYKVKGCVYRLEQRKAWNIGLGHLPNRDSFDVEFSPSGLVLRVTTYSMAGTVIGSEHFSYNDSGKTSRSVEFDSSGRQIGTHDFVHENAENRVTTISKSEGKFQGRTVKVYDEKLLISIASYDGDNL